MTFILRLPALLVLLVLVLMSLAAAIVTTIVLADAPVDLGAVLTSNQIEVVRASSWLETGLWYGAGLLFLITAIRLLRRTQGFVTWLLGFACYAARWALAQQSDGGLATALGHVDPRAYLKPATLAAAPESATAQIGVLLILAAVGLAILIIDAADRAYWDRQSA